MKPDWGTVPAWASAILTGGSLLLGFYILLRDRRKEERAGASRLVFSTRLDRQGNFHVKATNLSDQPFLLVEMVDGIWQTSPAPDESDPLNDPSLQPGETRIFTHLKSDPPAKLGVTIQDADGMYWLKILHTRRLVRLSGTMHHAGAHLERHQIGMHRTDGHAPGYDRVEGGIIIGGWTLARMILAIVRHDRRMHRRRMRRRK
ncbi:hypothetical protein [Streptomyces sp. NPDC088785]|uniref:hypothetical protein n=1 Tax=Streptomyces sp. NPDC088785 TaxID=3365897 RepID=UPI003810EE89